MLQFTSPVPTQCVVWVVKKRKQKFSPEWLFLKWTHLYLCVHPRKTKKKKKEKLTWHCLDVECAQWPVRALFIYSALHYCFCLHTCVWDSWMGPLGRRTTHVENVNSALEPVPPWHRKKKKRKNKKSTVAVETNVFDAQNVHEKHAFIPRHKSDVWVHKVARINKSSAFEITSHTDEVMSCFSHQDISSHIFLSQRTFPVNPKALLGIN